MFDHDLPIIIAGYAICHMAHVFVFFVRAHLAQVPQPKGLVFAVGNDITPVALCGNVGDAFRMSNQHAGGPLGGPQ